MKPAFPLPDDAAISHSLALIDTLRQRIKAQGPMRFSDYMHRVLYTPGLGYYSAGSAKIGAAGDFITAPEISSTFARCLARQCQQVLQALSQPIIMELGAGLGSLAADLLLTLEQCDSLPLEYWILEPSAELAQRQFQLLQARCPHLINRVKWLDSLPKQDFNGIILGNEVIDALAIARFMIKNTQIVELGVDFNGERFEWAELSASNPALITKVTAIQKATGDFPEGYCSEINLYLNEWLKSVTEHLHQGVAIWIDYGYPRDSYYHASRSAGTLMNYYRHHAHSDPFLYPGLQDITAHVDFTALAEAGLDSGLELSGYISQGMFLINCGVGELLQAVDDITEQTRIKKLISPQHMGESFKVMALSRNMDLTLMGFSAMQERHKL
ncbi:MAG: SAM-dependent methyltransferase [Gammaproteobacteria bacterium]|nr:SAM-dependent methyltransferase [Gammaproteobacteria bacterium]